MERAIRKEGLPSDYERIEVQYVLQTRSQLEKNYRKRIYEKEMRRTLFAREEKRMVQAKNETEQPRSLCEWSEYFCTSMIRKVNEFTGKI